MKNFVEKFTYESLYEKSALINEISNFFDAFSEGIIITDKNGRIIIYNRAKEIQENRNRKEMIGKFTWDAYNYSGIKASEHWTVFQTGCPVINKYSAHSIVDGIPRYISYSTYPLIINNISVGVYSVSVTKDSLHQNLVETLEKKRELNESALGYYDFEYSENGTRYDFSDIMGQSNEMKNVIHMAQNIAFLENSILIIGETGTGKEVLSQSIHNFGERSNEPFIGINCSAIPENLLESMLFGTKKGAYTGAVDSTGLFEKAKKGTLFLDDINTMPLALQAKLLRVLQEKRIYRIGSSKTYKVNCRIISATNEDPFLLIDQKKLREDLFYRIAGFTIKIPPLRERKEDIILLLEYFLRKYNKVLDKMAMGVDPILKKVLYEYPWPGNIRELENLVENMLVNAESNEKYLGVNHIPIYLKKRFLVHPLPQIKNIIKKYGTYNKAIEDFERTLLLEALHENHWNYSKTARKLHLNRNSLLYKIKRLNISKT